MRKTKIIATMGPATDNPDVLRPMLKAGLDVARFNFSHGTHEDHKKRIDNFRALCKEVGVSVALLADTKGPEIRLGVFKDGEVELVAGSSFTLTTDMIEGDVTRASVTYENLHEEVAPGTRILLDDGLIELSVESVQGKDIVTRVVDGGSISNRKGVNVPGVRLNMPYVSSSDRADLRFFIEMGFDLIAASFCRSEDDIRNMRSELARVDDKNKIRIIAKIENADGLKNIDAILEAADGIMVARGDLGVEMAYEELPILQKDLISKALYRGKEVVTATQMLESMIHNPRPTRAETSDVANAIYDGTNAIMLSGETAAGKYPLEAFLAMARIATRIESSIDYRKRFVRDVHRPEESVTNAISHATVTAAHELEAACIITVSMSGLTARNVAKYRPLCPIVACTPDPVTARQLKLVWGAVPILTKEEVDTSDLFTHAVDLAVEAGFCRTGELVVITAGVPVGHSGTTNLLKVHVVGEKAFIY